MGESFESSNCLKPSLPFVDMDPSLEIMSQELNGSAMEIPSLGLMGYFNDDCLSQLYVHFPDHSFGFLPTECQTRTVPSQPAASVAEKSHGDRIRNNTEAPETGKERSSAARSEVGLTEVNSKKNNNSLGSGKRARGKPKKAEKPKEVVHVRARRGQATDSHSLAERVRREKINERMRCLQDLVPGCYKTMGMAGMLDEIISYVQSLQNQVEFLSLKLSTASSFCDYCFDTEAAAATQANNVQEAARLVGEGYGGCSTTGFPSTMPF